MNQMHSRARGDALTWPGAVPDCLRQMVEELPTPAALLLGPDYRYQVANRSHRDWFLQGNDPVGKTVLEAIPEAIEQGYMQLLDQVVATGTVYEGKEASIRLRQKNGSSRLIYFNFMYQPFLNEKREVVGVMATASDVTEGTVARLGIGRDNVALAAYREHLAQLFANVAHFFLIWQGEQFVYEFSNVISDRLVGGSPIGKRLVDVVPNAQSSGLIDLLNDVWRSGEARFIPDIEVSLHGVPHSFEVNYVPRRNAAGEVDGIMALGLDTTERGKERTALDKSQRELAMAVHVARIGFFDWHIQKGSIELSAWMRDLYELEEGATIEQVFAVVHGEDIDRIRKSAYHAIDVSKQYFEHHRLQRKDGSVLWVESIGAITSDKEGQPERFFGTVRDITELKQALASLAMQQHVNESIISQSPAGIGLLQGEGLVPIKTNHRWQMMDAALLAGQNLQVSSAPIRLDAGTTSIELGSLPGLLRQVWTTGETLSVKECRVAAAADGGAPQERWVNVDASLVRDGQALPFGVVCQLTDVSEVVRPRLALAANVDELCRERELREHFVNTLTHDLRTPLTAAKMSANLILRKHAKEAPLIKLGQRIVRCIDRAEAMVQNLLDASRLKAGQALSLDLVPAALDDLIGLAVEDLTVLHDRTFRFVKPNKKVHAYVDTDAVRRILDNLGGNAVKYGAKSQPITISLADNGTTIALSVHNEGPPIPPTEQGMLFEPYKRAAAAVQSGQKGWGLGLSLVKGLTEAHGGTVSVHSAEQIGTTFVLTLPHA